MVSWGVGELGKIRQRTESNNDINTTAERGENENIGVKLTNLLQEIEELLIGVQMA